MKLLLAAGVPCCDMVDVHPADSGLSSPGVEEDEARPSATLPLGLATAEDKGVPVLYRCMKWVCDVMGEALSSGMHTRMSGPAHACASLADWVQVQVSQRDGSLGSALASGAQGPLPKVA